jgi:ABC-type nitrate/sulfonate/bicarbonate transport system substrate-binding protein
MTATRRTRVRLAGLAAFATLLALVAGAAGAELWTRLKWQPLKDVVADLSSRNESQND